MASPHPQCVSAPGDERNHHHRGQLHDPQGFFARFGDPLDVLPPEIKRYGNGERRRREVRLECEFQVRVGKHLVQQAGEILSRRNSADRSCKHVIEHQRGNGKLSQRAAHGLLHHAVNAAPYKHAAALDIYLGNRVGEQHRGEDEPGSGLADELLGFTARVVG